MPVPIRPDALPAIPGGTVAVDSAIIVDDGDGVWKATPPQILASATPSVLGVSGGSALVGFLQAGTGADTRAAQDKLRERVSAADFSFSTAATGTENAARLAEAIAYLVTLGGGIVNIGPGTFTLNTVTLASDITIQGAGIDATIIVQGTTTSASYGALTANSGSSSAYVENLSLRDFTIKSTVGTLQQFMHLISLNGVRNALVERIKFQGFQGDGLYIGSGTTGGDERHNINVTVRDCTFDGVNKANRAGISVIDWNGITIENCLFITCTDATMPGPLNFEPDDNAFHVCKDATVRGCRFEACGGNVSQIGLFVPSAVTASPTGFRVLFNAFISSVGGYEILVNTNRTVAATGTHSGVKVIGNYGKSGSSGVFFLAGVRGVLVEGNTLDTYPVYGSLGFNGSTDLLRDCEFLNNTLILVGTDATLPGLLVSKVNGLALRGNKLDRCGAASSAGRAIGFHDVAVTSDRVSIEDNEVIAAASQTAAVTVGASHTLTPANNRKRNNAYGSLTDAFLATAPGQVLNPATLTWDPASLIDGAGETSSAVTVTGAAFGDTVVCTAPYDLQGIGLTAYVSASDAAKARLQNESTATVDLASGTYTFTVTKKAA